MVKHKLKKLLTSAVSTAMLATSISVTGVASSPVSAASDNNYMEALALSLYMFDANACGTEVTGGPLTWRGNCHTYDAQASVGSLDSSLKSVVDPDGDGKIDVSGGWHDAGDHIKFNLTIGFGASSLAMSEYLNPGIYEKAGCKDHLIYELKWASDYLMKTTFLDGSGNVAAIAHVVADGGVDHNIWTAPETQTYDRPVYWLTASKNNSAVCGEMAAALAGTAYVVKDSDPTYAAECIKYAKALVSFGKNHTGNEGGGLSAFYGTDSQYQDEMALADAWLWINGEGSKPTLTPSGGQYSGMYDYYLYCWDKVWQGYATMMYKATGDSTFASELEFELNNQGGLSEGSYNGNGWGASRYNCAKQMNALALAKGDANSSYAKACKYQMDYILGNNPTGYSFLLGYGNKWPTHIHHRAANPGNGNQTSADNIEAKYTAYGMLVGGSDSSGNYEDHSDRYQYTEGALDYNGCFAIACAGLANLYGGDTSAIKTLVSNASEIDASFKFGDTQVDPPVPGTTTAVPGPVVTTTTTTKVTTAPPVISEERVEASVSGSNGSWTVNANSADAIEITFKSTAGAEANGAIGYTSGTWKSTNWSGNFNSNGELVVTVDLDEGVNDVKIDKYYAGYWDNNTSSVVNVDVELSKAVLIYEKEVAATTTTAKKPVTTTTTTTKVPVITTTTTPTTTDTPKPDVVWGDADLNGKLSISDAVRILSYASNPEKAPLENTDICDVYNRGDGIDSLDSLSVQKKLTNVISELPESYMS